MVWSLIKVSLSSLFFLLLCFLSCIGTKFHSLVQDIWHRDVIVLSCDGIVPLLCALEVLSINVEVTGCYQAKLMLLLALTQMVELNLIG
jgi:hypothetical protein